MGPAPKAEPLKQRVNRCLLRLSDRDTEAMAAAELDAIARGLEADELPSFLAAVSDARPTDRTPLRRHSLRLLALLAAAHPRDAASAPSADLAAYLQGLLPRLLKLLRSSAFKAKPALISLIGAASAASGGGSAATAVPSLRDALAGEDWAARKAAAEALALLALEHGDNLVDQKPSCIAVFEAKRFDKVKIVRESMNRMIEAWKEIPDMDEEVCSSDAPSPQSQTRSSSTDYASDGRYPADSLGSNSVQSLSRRNSYPTNKSPPREALHSVSNRRASNSIVNKKNSPPSRQNSFQAKNYECKVNVIDAPDATPIKTMTEEKLLKDGNVRARLEARRVLFQKNGEERHNKVPGLKSGSRIVPYNGDDDLEETADTEDGHDEFQSGHKDEDLSKIRMQLVQIENQQTSLLNLLQKFMGSSQNGIRSLETRVNGLEMALDEISRDLTASSGRMPNSEPDMNCCILSPKFWRRHDGGRYSSKYSISDTANYSEESRTSYKWERQKFGVQGVVTNPLADPNASFAGNAVVAQEARRQNSAQYRSRMG
uniref:TORTIFOLIA1/SINE1-2 N-terminal domain-containing protein n=1 Tax=Leersia perrieri TaxID=77586 RepID=A0A0D9WNT7_9ORYZ